MNHRRLLSGLVQESSWVLLARICTVAASLASFKVLTVVLPTSELAKWSLFSGLVGFAGGLLSGPLNQALGRFAHDAQRQSQLSSLTMGIAVAHVCAITLLVLPATAWLAWGANALDASAQIAVALAGCAVMGTLYVTFSGLANVLRLRRSWAIAVGVEGAVRLAAIGVALLTVGRTLWTPVVATFVGPLCGALVALRALRRIQPGADESRVPLLAWRPLWTFAYPLIWVTFGWWFLQVSNRYILDRFATADAVAAYAVASGLVIALVGGLEGLISTVTLPVLYSRLPGLSDQERDESGDRTARVGMQAVLLATAGLPFLSLPLLTVFSGPRYYWCAPLVSALFIPEWFRAAAGQMNSAFYARFKTRAMFSPLSFAVVVQLGLAPLCIHFLGLWGTVIGSFAAYAALLLRTYLAIPSVLRVDVNWRGWFVHTTGVAAAGLTIGVLYGLGPQRMVAALVALVLYGSVVLAAVFLMRDDWEATLGERRAIV
jgi:O-antigen/teichoic acid export membrane protein